MNVCSEVRNTSNMNYFCLKDTFTLLIKPLKLRALLDQVTDWRFGMYVNAVLVSRLVKINAVSFFNICLSSRSRRKAGA